MINPAKYKRDTERVRANSKVLSPGRGSNVTNVRSPSGGRNNVISPGVLKQNLFATNGQK